MLSGQQLLKDTLYSAYEPGRLLTHATEVQYRHHFPNSRIVDAEGFWFVDSRLPFSVKTTDTLAARQFNTSVCDSRALGTPIRLPVDTFVSLIRRN